MTRNELLQLLAEKLINMPRNRPLLVGIDGVDASGKTTLANELAQYLKNSNYPIIRASIDGFHNPEEVRYQRGADSAEGYYKDSFDLKAVQEILLQPLKTGNLEYKKAAFDYRTNEKIGSISQKAETDSILIMEGIFLFRPELINFWDLKIFLDVDFPFTLKRALKREAEKEHIGSEEKIREKYEKRYIPGQKLYFQDAHPQDIADIVIDNTDFTNPIIKKI